MAVEVKVPALGESIVEATVGEWLKAEGDRVTAGDPLVELETDKVAVEVTAEQNGVLDQIVHRAGDTVHVGDVLALLGDGARAEAPAAPVAPPREAPGQGPGARGEGSGVSGEGPGVRGQGSARPEGTPPLPPGPPPLTPAKPLASPLAAAASRAPASPSARRLAAEEGIDLSRVAGTGPGGRITREDVAACGIHRDEQDEQDRKRPDKNRHPVHPGHPVYPVNAGAEPAAAAEPAPPPPLAPHPESPREERVRLSRRRLTIARRLVEAQQTAAILTTFNEIDMSQVLGLRQRRRDEFKERHGVSLGFMSFFAKATVGALKAFPPLNAEMQEDTLVLKHYYDLGIAVAAPEGLVVPVVRDVDRKSFAQIEREIADLAKRARENSLTLEELAGGTFTITNGGVFGSLLSTPILNPPQVGILGMHRIQERPVAVKGQVEIRPMMYVALSYDHRIVDGSEAVQYLVRIKTLIEDPEALLLEG